MYQTFRREKQGERGVGKNQKRSKDFELEDILNKVQPHSLLSKSPNLIIRYGGAGGPIVTLPQGSTIPEEHKPEIIGYEISLEIYLVGIDVTIRDMFNETDKNYFLGTKISVEQISETEHYADEVLIQAKNIFAKLCNMYFNSRMEIEPYKFKETTYA
jgi:hypothetical protein